MIYRYRKFDFPILEIRISDIGKCDDLPILENDLPIPEIQITNISKCRINVHLIPHSTPQVNEAPPMPLRASSFLGSPIAPVVLPWHGTVAGRDYLPESNPRNEPRSLAQQR